MLLVVKQFTQLISFQKEAATIIVYKYSIYLIATYSNVNHCESVPQNTISLDDQIKFCFLNWKVRGQDFRACNYSNIWVSAQNRSRTPIHTAFSSSLVPIHEWKVCSKIHVSLIQQTSVEDPLFARRWASGNAASSLGICSIPFSSTKIFPRSCRYLSPSDNST